MMEQVNDDVKIEIDDNAIPHSTCIFTFDQIVSGLAKTRDP
jgi:hypothetical protein